MPRSLSALFALLRSVALGAAILAMFLAGSLGLQGIHLDLAKGVLLLFTIGAFLPHGALLRPAVPLLLLTADVTAIGVIGAFLRLPDPARPSVEASLPFVAGYIVAILVAVTGRRPGAAALGALAGVMLLLLGESQLVVPTTTPAEPVAVHAAGSPDAGIKRTLPEVAPAPETHDLHLWLRLLLLAVASFECALVTGWIDADLRRRRTAETVERELRAREMIATELASFTAAAKSAGTLRELAEALLSHVRVRFNTSARAVFLEDAVERVAVWEETGRVNDKSAEQRRLRLQEALRDAGSTALVPRLETRTTSGSPARPAKLLTGVGVPVHATGRVGGVVFVADVRRDALAHERLNALAELARQTGDSMRRLERARDEQTRRTGILLGQMREGVLLLGSDGRVLLCNPAGREVLEALGQTTDSPVTLGEASPEELAMIAAGTARRFTMTAQVDTGRTLRLAVSAVGVADGGTRLGTLVTLTDVTEEEQARRRLVQAEKMSVVGQTLASVAHELNNPLAAIVGYADLLTDAVVPPDVERLLGRIREQATRTSRIVKNLLNVVRRRGPERTLISLNEIVTSVVELFAYDARLSNILVLSDLDPGLPQVTADKHALQQILVNLVQNSLQSIRGAKRPGRIEIKTRTERGQTLLTVRDDGPGIPAEARARLFEAFFTTKVNGEGTGLGLAISRGIAREHGGDLLDEDRSDGKVGAQFTMRIPLTSSVPLGHAPSDRVIPEGVPARVLVIDDEAAVRDSLIATLGRLGAQVDGVGSTEEARRIIERGAPYDAVLSDVRLPGQSGIDFHRMLTAKNPLQASKFVFMTGDLVNEDVMKAVKSTGMPYVEKPFTAEELREVLGKVGTPQT